jgi:hypothetical protein
MHRRINLSEEHWHWLDVFNYIIDNPNMTKVLITTIVPVFDFVRKKTVKCDAVTALIKPIMPMIIFAESENYFDESVLNSYRVS